MLARLHELLRHHASWLPERAHLLVAVSGGRDSAVLLHALHSLQKSFAWGLTVAHIHHGIRPEESQREEEYVRSLAASMNLPCVVVHLGLAAQSPVKPRPAAARVARYQALERIALERGADRILLGHHADDQVETIMLHLLRGSGPGGLAAMRPVSHWQSVMLVRPLLTLSRELLAGYAERVGLQPCFDSSNVTLDQARNRLRYQLLPQLPAYNPRYREAFVRLASVLQAEEEVWEGLLAAVCAQVLQERSSTAWRLDQAGYTALPLALQRRLIRHVVDSLFLTPCELPWSLVESIRRVAIGRFPSRRIHLPQGGWFERNYATLTFRLHAATDASVAPQPHSGAVVLPIPGRVGNLGWAGMVEAKVVAWAEAATQPIPLGVQVAVFDADALPKPLVVRTRRQGDRIGCAGMQGTKKLKKLLMEARIPQHCRDRLPLVLAGSDLLWVPGVRYARLAKVGRTTHRCLVLSYSLQEEPDDTAWLRRE